MQRSSSADPRTEGDVCRSFGERERQESNPRPPAGQADSAGTTLHDRPPRKLVFMDSATPARGTSTIDSIARRTVTRKLPGMTSVGRGSQFGEAGADLGGGGETASAFRL